MYKPDTSPEQQDFEQFCILHDQRHLARSVGLYEAMEVFRAELPELCLSKIGADEQAEAFKDLLQKLRRWAAQPHDQLNVLKAKAYPILRLAEELSGGPVKFNKIKAPGERTASIHIYEDTNTWWDFGRQRGTDVIDLYMLFTGCPFREAVRRLAS